MLVNNVQKRTKNMNLHEVKGTVISKNKKWMCATLKTTYLSALYTGRNLKQII